MADDFNSWGGAGASAGGWGDGMVRRAARGLGRWMGDGMPASQQMRDWYQQYAAEHGRNNAQWGWKRDNYPQPSGNNMQWGWHRDYYQQPTGNTMRDMQYRGSPRLPTDNTMQWTWQRDSYAGPSGTVGQKGLRDVPAEGQQPQVGIGQNPYSPEHVQQMRNSNTFVPHPAQWVTDDLGNTYLRPESTWNSVGSFAPGGGSTSVDWRAQALMQAQAEIASGNPSQWAWNIVQMQQNDPSWVTTGIREAQGYLDAANNGLLRQDTATAINQIYQPLTQQFGAVQEFANNWQPPQQVAPQQAAPQKSIHDTAAPAGYGGINPNLLAAIRRGQGA